MFSWAVFDGFGFDDYFVAYAFGFNFQVFVQKGLYYILEFGGYGQL